MNKHPLIAITGGIGSGKSFVCRLLKQKGIEVYDCDAAAKRLMASDAKLQAELSNVVGCEIFVDGVLQKPLLTKFLLESDTNKQAINDVVHPAVAADFLSSRYSWLESAILFESGFDKRICFDYIVGVTAPVDLRISRIMSRDNISKEQAEMWLRRQTSQQDVANRCNFLIVNDGTTHLATDIDAILEGIYQSK